MITVGIDEVGRGCWAGPLVAAAVVLTGRIEGLRDSKKLTAHERTRLDQLIKAQAMCYGMGWVWPEEIDAIGLTKAVSRAMETALSAIDCKYEEIIIDGSYNFLPLVIRLRTQIKADDSVPAVSAASIVAKVARDAYMAQASAMYPGYGFESNVGYGTAAHILALQQYGVTPLHRQSYKPIKQILVQSLDE